MSNRILQTDDDTYSFFQALDAYCRMLGFTDEETYKYKLDSGWTHAKISEMNKNKMKNKEK
jgi:hypothetical protein